MLSYFSYKKLNQNFKFSDNNPKVLQNLFVILFLAMFTTVVSSRSDSLYELLNLYNICTAKQKFYIQEIYSELKAQKVTKQKNARTISGGNRKI
jgi:hypothetical protein